MSEPKFKLGSAWTGDWRESLVVRDEALIAALDGKGEV